MIQSVSHSSHSNGQLRGLFLREMIYIHSDNNHKNVVNGPLLDCLYFFERERERERKKERDLIYVLSLPERIDFFIQNSIQNGLCYSVFVCTVYYVDAFKNCLKIIFFREHLVESY